MFKWTIHLKFGVQRSGEQLCKRWSDLKIREPEHVGSIQRVIRRRRNQAAGVEQTNPTQCQASPLPDVQDVENATTSGGICAVGDGLDTYSAQVLIGEVLSCRSQIEDINICGAKWSEH